MADRTGHTHHQHGPGCNHGLPAGDSARTIVRALFSLAGGGQASCAEVRSLAASHLKDVRARITDLKRMERALADSVRACDAGLDPGCPLIETLYAERNRPTESLDRKIPI